MSQCTRQHYTLLCSYVCGKWLCKSRMEGGYRLSIMLVSERELMFMFAICRRASVCLSVTLVHPTQPIEIFGNVSAPFNTLVT